jgi:23S rRNA (adenine2503-C2)-methyltransferase
MFMSMGEPMLNWFHVRGAIEELNAFFPNAQLLISTMGINDPTIFTDMIKTSIKIDKVGLQFSVHAMYDEERDRIIPFKNKMDLRQLRNSGLLWSQATGRQVFLNYCFGSTIMFNLDRVFDMFDPMSFALTFSVVCENEVGKPRTQEVKDMVTASLYTIQQRCLAEGYNVRSFDPAGQDDIGGGCGQLWYVQDWMKQNGK